MQNINKDKTRINANITAKQVRVVLEDGEMLGVLSIKEALEKATDLGLDLVEISPDGTPPVCKIMDYGKHKYNLQKKKQEARKKQKTVIVKELYLHLSIGEHDYQVRLKQLKKFLESSNKTKICIKLRGREMAYNAKAMDVLNRFYEDIGKDEMAKIEYGPKLEGNNAIVIFAPVT